MDSYYACFAQLIELLCDKCRQFDDGAVRRGFQSRSSSSSHFRRRRRWNRSSETAKLQQIYGLIVVRLSIWEENLWWLSCTSMDNSVAINCVTLRSVLVFLALVSHNGLSNCMISAPPVWRWCYKERISAQEEQYSLRTWSHSHFSILDRMNGSSMTFPLWWTRRRCRRFYRSFRCACLVCFSVQASRYYTSDERAVITIHWWEEMGEGWPCKEERIPMHDEHRQLQSYTSTSSFT